VEKLSVFPNPASDIIIIENKNIGSGIAEIFNNIGVRKLGFKLNKDQTQLDIKNLKEGFYYIHIKAEGLVYSAKFLKR
jgi:hypothetical protein